MKSSILITSYNKGKYIDQCISSCINQDIADDIEILVLDNYSEDTSNEVFNKYRDNIKIFKKKRVSIHPALNQIDLIKEGLSISNGNLIYLLDGDDFFLKNKLHNVNNIFKKNPNIKVVFDTSLKKSENKFSTNKIKISSKVDTYGKRLVKIMFDYI